MLSPQRWKEIEPIIDAALELPEVERAAFVADSCGDDSAKLADVMKLLSDAESRDSILDAPAIASWLSIGDGGGAGDDGDDMRSTLLSGRYRVGDEIGHGGMAIVYRGYDERLRRPVAIKVLRSDMSHAHSGARFDAEIRLTANLRHANIVPLFDSGVDTGRAYFVMPLIEGETLRDRLVAGALQLPEALRIMSGVLAALEYAHGQQVVHRDVKPSNVMLTGPDVLLADFGIAHAGAVADAALTQTGMVVGTPSYMSPEQATGSAPVGAASDVYSAACLLSEMITGTRLRNALARIAVADAGVDPYEGEQGDVMRVAPQLSPVLRKALAIDPAQRIATAAAFAGALRDASSSPVAVSSAAGSTPLQRSAHGLRVRRWGVIVAVAGAAAVAIVAWQRIVGTIADVRTEPAAIETAADTAEVALLPYEYDSSASVRFDRPDQLRAAIRKWNDVHLVDDAAVGEATVGRVGSTLRAKELAAIALRVHAGRYIRRDVSVQNGLIHLHAALYDARTSRPVSAASAIAPMGAALADSTFDDLAGQLLLAGVERRWRSRAASGTSSLIALTAFSHAMAAVDRWDLPVADSMFGIATATDSGFVRAELWLAQVRVWRDRPVESWTYLLNSASRNRAGLTLLEQRTFDALRAQGDGDTPRACATWQRIAMADSTSFPAWYGAANCLMHDQAVVRDARSPSGWRFRSSYAAGIRDLRRAFNILPAVHLEFRATWYNALAAMLLTAPRNIRIGAASKPDTGAFFASPSWDVKGDSLLLIPYRIRDFERSEPWTRSATLPLAVRRQREVLREIATTWRAAYPRSAFAMLAVAISLDQLGDESAADSISLARSLAIDAEEKLLAGTARIWLLVKYGLPDNLAALSSAQLLADSLLRAFPVANPSLADALASVSVFSGHVSAAARIEQGVTDLVDHGTRVPTQLSQLAQVLQVYAAIGAPIDSIAELERRGLTAIERSVAADKVDGVRVRFFGRAAMMAFPRYRSGSIPSLAASGDLLAAAQDAWTQGKVPQMREYLLKLQQARRGSPPYEVMLETVLPEAEILAASGDARSALDRLASTQDVLAASDLETLKSPVGAGILMRSVAVRAALEAQVGTAAGAARWSRALHVLWRSPDDFLRPLMSTATAMSGNRGR